MPCHKCPKCGYQYCDIDECPICHGKGIKKEVQKDKLKKVLEELGRNDKCTTGL